jgi:hypothetical protein
MSDTITGWAKDAEDAEVLTLAGLIAGLQQQLDLDPDMADRPVEIWPLGQDSRTRFVLTLVSGTGNPDPAAGGHLRTVLFAIRSSHGPKI